MSLPIEILECQIASKRNTKIPATFTYPKRKDACPLIIAAHGFQSSRHEYGLYTELANRLAEAGIAVIRFDFPGNNDSEESMDAYTLTNNLDDMDCAMEYAMEHRKVDSRRIGVLGWSMGGYMASLFSQRHPEILAMALWAPAVCALDVVTGMEGEKSYLENFERAIKDGHCVVAKEWCTCDVSKDFFLEVLCSNPYAALNQYRGELFFALGLQDSVLNASHVQLGALSAVNAKHVTTCYFEDGDHDFGTAYGKGEGDPEITQTLLKGTVDFFVSVLSE